MQELKFKYDNRFNTEGNRIKKYFGDSPYHAISGKGKSIATFGDCKTLGDCQKKIESLGILKPEYSLNDIEQTIAYNIKNHINDPKAKDDFLKLLTNTEQIISKLKNNETQGDKND